MQSKSIIGGSRGRHGNAPLDQNFFTFMQVVGKIGQIIGWCHH